MNSLASNFKEAIVILDPLGKFPSSTITPVLELLTKMVQVRKISSKNTPGENIQILQNEYDSTKEEIILTAINEIKYNAADTLGKTMLQMWMSRNLGI